MRDLPKHGYLSRLEPPFRQVVAIAEEKAAFILSKTDLS
jgi:hypothetical protein